MKFLDELKLEAWEADEYIITGFGVNHPGTLSKREGEQILAMLKLFAPPILALGATLAAEIAEQNKGKSKAERLKDGCYYDAETLRDIQTEEAGENIASHNINESILTAINNGKIFL